MKGKEFDKINNSLETADGALFKAWAETHPGAMDSIEDIKELLTLVVNFNTFIYSMWILDEDVLPDEAKDLKEKLLNGKIADVEIEKGEGGLYA